MQMTPDGALWRHSELVAAGQTSQPLYVPRGSAATEIAVGVSPVAGASALVEFTLSAPAAVDAGTAIWHAWDPGSVTAKTSQLFNGPITALRCTATTGNVTWEVLAQ